MVPLNCLHKGSEAKILKIEGGKTLTGQLKHIGLHEGDNIHVIQKTHGPMIVAKGAARIALGKGMSQKIFVEHLPQVKK